MNFSDHFPRTQSFYNQNPQKVHFAAGVGLGTTVTTSVLARVTSAPLPKTAKLAIFGLTFASNLASLNMKDASLGELGKVMMIGKQIVNSAITDVKHAASECYKKIGEALQTEANEVKADAAQTTSADIEVLKLVKNTSPLEVDLLAPQVKSIPVSLPQLGDKEVIAPPKLSEILLSQELITPDQTSSAELPLAGSDIPQEPPITSAE
jgi:hypothetical protein